jgi:HJR/Mrr/RecB family endonuclease
MRARQRNSRRGRVIVLDYGPEIRRRGCWARAITPGVALITLFIITSIFMPLNNPRLPASTTLVMIMTILGFPIVVAVILDYMLYPNSQTSADEAVQYETPPVRSGSALARALLREKTANYDLATPDWYTEQRAGAGKTLMPVAALTPSEFEFEVAWVFEQLMGVQCKVVGGAGDGGVDIRVYKAGRYVGIVQCKKYALDRAVSPMHIRDLESCKRREGVQRAIMVTTSRFSDNVVGEARSNGLDLIDGSRYEEMRQRASRQTAAQASF